MVKLQSILHSYSSTQHHEHIKLTGHALYRHSIPRIRSVSSNTNSLALGMTHHEREVVGEGGEPNLWCP
jgi:hypothetical protein